MNESGTNKPGGGEQPTEKMKSVPPEGRGGRLGALLRALRENPLYAGTAAGVILIAVAILVVVSLIGGGSDDAEAPRYATLKSVGISWTQGQSSLASYDQFDAIAQRANVLGSGNQSSYWEGQQKYDDDRVEARKRAEREARRRYLEARKRAEAAYQAALEKAKRDRAEALRKQKAEQAAILRRLRHKYRIKPGEECSLPEIRAQFDCSTGYPF